MRPFLNIGGLLAIVVLAGCQSYRDPLPYSPNYGVAGGATADEGLVQKGSILPGGATAGLVPDACVTPDIAPQPLYLPSGCANNVNLQLMTERESDLLHGRSTGPAMAGPTVRAARRVIDGEPSPSREAGALSTAGGALF